MSSLKAEDFIERSPVYPLHHCALTDLSELPRVGFRGTDSAAWLQARGYRLPGQPNQALRQDDGSRVTRLSQTEYLLLGSLDDMGARVAAEEASWVFDDSRNYLL
ncbi:MAG TPA: sarcosine oxidase, partial [Pseudomonas sp.]|nr:sarcosine oxidase [Pseudomonas sp.]